MSTRFFSVIAICAGVGMLCGQPIRADEWAEGEYADDAFWESEEWSADTYADAATTVEFFSDEPDEHVLVPRQPQGRRVVATRAECVELLRTYPWAIEYAELQLVHEHWRGPVRVNAEYRVLVSMTGLKSVATVLRLSEQELRVKWDDFGEESFYLQKDGTYLHENQARRQAGSLGSRVRSSVAGAVAEESYGWTDRVVDAVLFHDAPLTYKTLQLVSPVQSVEVHLVEEQKTLTTTGEKPLAAVVLDYTGDKLHLRWETGWVESYARAEDGSYHKMNDTQVARWLRDPKLPAVAEASWLAQIWNRVVDEDAPLYVPLKLKQAGKTVECRLSMEHRLLVNMEPASGWAKVVSYDSGRLLLRWHDMLDESYVLGVDGVFVPVK